MTQIINLQELTATTTTTNVVLPVVDLNSSPGITKKLTLSNLVKLSVGPQGTQGVPGQQGVMGFTGSTGAGYIGSPGFQGSLGYTGSRGLSGAGFNGSRGYSGSAGYVGSAGPSANQSLNTNSNVVFASVGFADGTVQTTAFPKSVLTLNNLSVGDYDISSKAITNSILVTPTNMVANRKLNLPAPILAAGTVVVIRNRDASHTLELRYNGFSGVLVGTINTGSSITIVCDNSTWFIETPTSGGGGNGYTGSAGSIGFTGSVGIGYTGSGSTGFTGSAGSAGATGSAGFTGSAGAQGIIGYTGSASGGGGGNGYTGSTGFTGSAGSFSGSTSLQIVTTNATQSSSTITGALIVTGGAGIGGNLNVGGTLTMTTLLIGQSGIGTIQSGNDLALKATGNITTNAPFVLNSYTTSTLGAIVSPVVGSMAFILNGPGGSQPCFYDGSHWYTVDGKNLIV